MEYFTVLGEAPYGGPEDGRAITPIGPSERERVLSVVREMIDTAKCVAKRGPLGNIADCREAPIDPSSFEPAIRSYRDRTPGKEDLRRRQRISTTDVLLHLARASDRLLKRIGALPPTSTPGGFPGRFEPLAAIIDRQDQQLHSMEAIFGAPTPNPAIDDLPTSDVAELEASTVKYLEAGRIPRPHGIPAPRVVATATGNAYERSAWVRSFILQEANGTCEDCDAPAPFITRDGFPYLEVHHVIRLADQGPDTPENTIALCPNCHRRLHHARDAEARVDRLRAKVARLRETPPRPQ